MVCEITIYTAQGALGFTVKSTGADFQARLMEALESGMVVLDTADGTQLIINALNVVAIEIGNDEKAPPP